MISLRVVLLSCYQSIRTLFFDGRHATRKVYIKLMCNIFNTSIDSSEKNRIHTATLARYTLKNLRSTNPVYYINFPNRPFNQTLLHYFAAIGASKGLEILLDAGGDMSLRDKKKASPFTLMFQHCFFGENLKKEDYKHYQNFFVKLFIEKSIKIPSEQILSCLKDPSIYESFPIVSRVEFPALSDLLHTSYQIDLLYFVASLAYVNGSLDDEEIEGFKTYIGSAIGFDEARFNDYLAEFEGKKSSLVNKSN